ncbi:MAG: Trk system potassium transporter TrkA [Lachnospiraceae bacterium]|nr:Trk system potassium transporter TrkA [Lachnospiraceae bacterium]MEE0686211.1 Trk system potassium transporter TrkA [Lachnospiraceae bacterium]
MRIIIVGCGKVGYVLTEQLTKEGHDICLIDKDEDKLARVSSNMDVFCLQGNGTSYATQIEAGIKEADLLISVTESDEINMLCCLIAKKAGNCKTIARVRKPEYDFEVSFLKEELGLSMAINPEMTAAAEMSRLIQYPSALEVETFVKGRVTLIKVAVTKDSPLDGLAIKDMSSVAGKRTLVCIVDRAKEITIPNGDFVLKEGDIISLILPVEESNAFFKKMKIKSSPIKSVIIAGGGTTSFYLAKQLQKTGVSVKIIEENKVRCEELSELLPNAMVINGSCIDKDLLLSEGITDIDAMAALTPLDEENILLTMYAKKVGKCKTMTRVDKLNFGEVLGDLNMDTVISAKAITAAYIIRYVRAMQNSYGSKVQTLHRLYDGQVEALEFRVTKNAKVIEKSLFELNLKNNLLVCCISRKGKIITPSGQDMLMPGDGVIVVTTNTGLRDIDDILAVNKA